METAAPFSDESLEAAWQFDREHPAPVVHVERETPLGKTAMLSVDSTGTSGVLYVRWYDLPAAAQPQGEAREKEFLDRSRDLILARVGSKLLGEEPLADAPFKAKRFFDSFRRTAAK